MNIPTPHGDKLTKLVENWKLPSADKPRVNHAIANYKAWIEEIAGIAPDDDLVSNMVTSLNRYKRSIDLDLIFDSSDEFLYRQKGQLKLDNTVLEEFLPWLVRLRFADRIAANDLAIGPVTAFAQLRFDSQMDTAPAGGSLNIRSKNQDFALSRPLFLRASHNQDFTDYQEARTNLAYVAAEIKTNLDKTMFQEASATAYDLKLAIPSSQYFLLCEWLDMPPISSAVTMIEEVLILRRARRLSADKRSEFSDPNIRKQKRGEYAQHLDNNPFSVVPFERFLSRIDRLFGPGLEDEQGALERGWF